MSRVLISNCNKREPSSTADDRIWTWLTATDVLDPTVEQNNEKKIKSPLLISLWQKYEFDSIFTCLLS